MASVGMYTVGNKYNILMLHKNITYVTKCEDQKHFKMCKQSKNISNDTRFSCKVLDTLGDNKLIGWSLDLPPP